jgi:hypothetical protein
MTHRRKTATDSDGNRDSVRLSLPLPPLVTHTPRMARNRVSPTHRFDLWRYNAGIDLHIQAPPALPAGATIGIAIRVGPSRRDLRGLGEVLVDLLREHGVIRGDDCVADLRLTKDRAVDPGRVAVEAWSLEMRRAA